MNYISNDYLIHHGVKGMRWGVRHDKQNPNYSSTQQKRDKAVYGPSGVKRINKNMNKGLSISGARSRESDRINAARRRARIGGQIGNTVGTVGGAIGGIVISKYANKKLNLNDPAMEFAVSSAISVGAGKVGQQLGRYGGQSIVMLSSGYDYKKFR